jgi:thiamine-monophosphate kinase
MIDVSDGIASELHHICHQSKVGAMIYANKLPIDYQTVKVGEDFNIGPTTFALNGGEDYELLFTLSLEDYDKVKSSPNFHIIGKITPDEKQVLILLDTGGVTDVEAQGWDHFN